MSIPRVGVVCDFVEDNWHSMDLVASMLLENLKRDFSTCFQAGRICPRMHPRLGRMPLFNRNGLGRKADQFLNRFHDYPRHLRAVRKNFDLFHVVDHTYAHLVHHLPAERTVVTCHDLDAFRCLVEPDRDRRPKLFEAMARRILSGLRRAARVVCDSASVRDELLHYRLLAPERLTVIPIGVHPSCTTQPDPSTDAWIASLLGPADPTAIDLLHVGSTIARKRIEVLLAVFAKVRLEIPNARLIRVGGPFTAPQSALVEQLGLQNSIVIAPFLSRQQLASVYRRASLVLQPSSGEGFGLPVVEAMACGTPVVASDLPVLREVGGEAAFYCPVDDVEIWSKRILELLSIARGAGWNAVRERAIAHAGKFSWPAYTAQTAQLYEELL